ncbi:hypothetical protein PG985_004347 [Apiospora marii]|uniref:Clr5 domain-containing protein n=1 Tax=Apiospora marii TaxID=335849 RepID=A0ABR1S922_9PEZI
MDDLVSAATPEKDHHPQRTKRNQRDMQITNTGDALGMYRDWEGYRSVITRLYSEENRPLKEVVHWMAQEYDFHAT